MRVFKTLICLLSVFFISFLSYGISASEAYKKALESESVTDSIDYLQKQIEKSSSLADKRSILFITGRLQEQAGLYSDASYSYAQASGIAASDADGIEKVSNEQLVLNAVRSSLCTGDFETADRYLNSSVRSSKNEKILAFINLYSLWSSLTKANSINDAADSIALLKAYSEMDSMKYVKSSILFTLWYVTGEKIYGEKLVSEFPLSPEAGVYKGKVQIMSVPFWYFVPHSSNETQTSMQTNENTNTIEQKTSTEKNLSQSNNEKTNDINTNNKTSENEKITRQQCGLFREKTNAQKLVDSLTNKGFDSYITTEKRASGTTYYIVVVNENTEGTIGLKLRDAGFECYPVVE